MVNLIRLDSLGLAVGPSPPRWNVDLQVTDVNGLPVAVQTNAMVRVFDKENGNALFSPADAKVFVSSGGAGEILGSNGPQAVVQTNESGYANLQIEASAGETVVVLMVAYVLGQLMASGQTSLEVTF